MGQHVKKGLLPLLTCGQLTSPHHFCKGSDDVDGDPETIQTQTGSCLFPYSRHPNLSYRSTGLSYAKIAKKIAQKLPKNSKNTPPRPLLSISRFEEKLPLISIQLISSSFLSPANFLSLGIAPRCGLVSLVSLLE